MSKTPDERAEALCQRALTESVPVQIMEGGLDRDVRALLVQKAPEHGLTVTSSGEFLTIARTEP